MLPLLGPTIRIWIFLAVIGSLQLFDIVWIMNPDFERVQTHSNPGFMSFGSRR